MLRKSKAPEIINIASAAAHYDTKRQSFYGASKFAVLGSGRCSPLRFRKRAFTSMFFLLAVY